MFKIFKYSIVLLLIKFNFASAEIIKPSTNIKPSQVIKIQLKSLMKNDAPYIDQGIEQTWEFAHPNNQKFTGPLSRFKEMIKGDSYNMLINHISHEVLEIYIEDERALYEVTVLDSDKKYYKFRWQVEKFLDKGPLKNCWLTTVVSQPIPLGSST
jgi:hypothetical protein|tara:strand:+ start:496 stop:960 length:465 start_codon:yes stop_codon:yes gene_type:complete